MQDASLWLEGSWGREKQRVNEREEHASYTSSNEASCRSSVD